jgi:hypothetical protein
MKVCVLTGLICATLLAAVSTAAAQSRNAPPPPAAPAAPAGRAGAQPPTPPPPPAPKKPGQLINIKAEFTITDQTGNGVPSKRTVTLIVADGDSGSIRSQPDAFGVPGGLQLNVDAQPEILTGNKIRLRFSLQYDGAPPLEAQGNLAANPPARGTVMKTTLRDSLSLILEDGKSMMVAQSADPTSDRKVTVDVKVTIMR